MIAINKHSSKLKNWSVEMPNAPYSNRWSTWASWYTVLKIVYFLKENLIKFDKIVQYLEDEWGEKTAENLIKNVDRVLKLIKVHPELSTMEVPHRNIRHV